MRLERHSLFAFLFPAVIILCHPLVATHSSPPAAPHSYLDFEFQNTSGGVAGASSNAASVLTGVDNVNDAPVITGQSPDPITLKEGETFYVGFDNLIVSDPDNDYPDDFTMTLSPGDNYSVDGNLITPSPDFFGNLSVPVLVNDGELNSTTFNLQVVVNAINDSPVITGQSDLTVPEDGQLAIVLANLQVSDPDGNYPTGYTMTLFPGDNYTVTGTTVIPVVDFSGMLTVPVIVNDGLNNSEPFPLSIAVIAVNDAPVITGQVALEVPEGQSIAISLTHLQVADPDNGYPDDFILSIVSGANYTVAGSTVTPAEGFNGVLGVGVFVNDGQVNSPVFSLQITVTAVNNPPVITDQLPLTTAEDQALTIHLSDLIVSDPDNTYPVGFTLMVLPGANYTTDGTQVIPATNFNGVLVASVTVNDGLATSEPFPVDISVTPVNDAPVITGQQAISTLEDVSVTIRADQLIINDPDNAFPGDFTLIAFTGENYTLNQNTICPASGFVGSLNVPVQVSDGELTSNIFNSVVVVTPVNDVPVITGQIPLATDEDTPVTITLAYLIVADPDNNYPADFTLQVHSGENYSTSGNTITPSTDFVGTLNVQVTVNDGSATSNPFMFQIQVGNANDPPLITGQSSLQTNEEQPFTLQLSHLTVYDPDNSYPSGFTLLVSSGENYSVTGATITPTVNFAGVLTIPVRVNDGINNSPSFGLQLTVSQVNDPPSFDAIPNQRVAENSPGVSISISNISKGPGENDQQVTFVANSSNTSIVPDPVVAYNGTGATATLTFKPAANASGVVTITVTAVDNGSATPPHKNTYSSSFQIEVVEINAAPTLAAISDVSVSEDAPQREIPLQGITAGAGESQQLSVTASTNKPQLLEVLAVEYSSPNTQGILKVKPAANVSGTATITVRVTDSGPGTKPHENTIARKFDFRIVAVNDPPVITSSPVSLAVVGEAYVYTIAYTDVESESLPVTALSKPPWLTLTNPGKGKALLSGTPPQGGTVDVTIRVTDGEVYADQQYSLLINTRPTVADMEFTLEEDEELGFEQQHFNSRYSDTDGNVLQAIRITQLPVAGYVLLNGVTLATGDTVHVSEIAGLSYRPQRDYSGNDLFYWKAFDGNHFSATAAAISISIAPVNDAPTVVIETDTLHFEVNGDPAVLSPEFAITDPDSDSITFAELTIQPSNFQPEADRLIPKAFPPLDARYDFQTGTLRLSGKASRERYEQAIRAIQYNYLNTVDPTLGMKEIALVVGDGQGVSEPRTRLVFLQYTFVELEIPNGFTPNGDQSNDTWIITRPGGLDQLQGAVIRVFNKRGVEVFRTVGFDSPWDGKVNGELLPAGSYFFTIDLRLRNQKVYRGIVTILR